MGGLGYVDSHEFPYWSSVETLAAWHGIERNGLGMLNIYKYALCSGLKLKQNRAMNLNNSH